MAERLRKMRVNNRILNFGLLFELVKKDFKSRYLGSYFGTFWAFFNPTITILIYWFVFQLGFRTGSVKEIPYVLWLSTGIIPWFFFSESLSGATYSIQESSYLVNKINFNVSLLPLIKIFSALIIHFFFLLLSIILLLLYGYRITIHSLQVFYYLSAVTIFTIGISWICSAINVFFRDMGQIVGVFIQFGFWLTPIFWTIDTLPKYIRFVFKFNPLYYITEGYRNSLLYSKWFWEDGYQTFYFWALTLFFLATGKIIFNKLRPHFSDVL